MAVRPVPNGIEARPVGSQVVQHEEASRLEEAEHQLISIARCVLEPACVEKQELEPTARRKQLAPVAEQKLDVRSPSSLRAAIAARSGSSSTVTTLFAVCAIASVPSPNAVPASATRRPTASTASRRWIS